MPETETIRTRHERREIFEIILNRPEKRNAIDWPMLRALGEAVAEAERREGVRVIVLRGDGPTFSSGVDLLAFQGLAEHFGPGWRDDLFAVTAAFQAVPNRLERGALPVIALLHNHCLGLALELALACDFRIAAEGTRLALPEARLGIIPDVGGTTRLTRLVGVARAKELIMTGRQFDAADAERWGIVNRVVPAADLDAAGLALAEELIAAAPLAVSYAKRVIDGLADLDRGLQLEAWAQSVLIRTRDFEHGAQAMLLKQQPEWTGR